MWSSRPYPPCAALSSVLETGQPTGAQIIYCRIPRVSHRSILARPRRRPQLFKPGPEGYLCRPGTNPPPLLETSQFPIPPEPPLVATPGPWESPARGPSTMQRWLDQSILHVPDFRVGMQHGPLNALFPLHWLCWSATELGVQ